MPCLITRGKHCEYPSPKLVNYQRVIVHYHPSSSKTIQDHPLSSIIIHYHPLSFIIIKDHPKYHRSVSFILIHRYPWFFHHDSPILSGSRISPFSLWPIPTQSAAARTSPGPTGCGVSGDTIGDAQKTKPRNTCGTNAFWLVGQNEPL